MGHLEAPQPPGEPGVRESVGGGDGEHRFVLGAEARERHSKPFFQKPDLIADRGLGHSELARSLGEILVPGGGLEYSNGGQRRDLTHVQMINPTYQLCREFSWRFGS
jgi:hypothetical protein